MDRSRPVARIVPLMLLAGAAQVIPGLTSAIADEPVIATGLHENMVFHDYPALARNSELLRRVFTPLTLADIKRDLAHSGKSLGETSVDPAAERFLMYVPPQKPPQGYGLLVFVPPWEKAQLPQGWAGVLDQFGMIFVSAARSGNDEDIISRREPLALIAAQNVMTQYAIDPDKVFVGGMSGGSRMALRLALAYPDLFRGALLNSGSDVIGTIYEPLPSASLFRQFQTATRLLYVTGTEDTANIETETHSRHAMEGWCVSDIGTLRMSFTGHEVAPPTVLTRALQSLLEPGRPDPERLADCRAGIEARVGAQLDRVEGLIAAGKRQDAQKLLKEIDAKFGGMAAPRSVALDLALTNPRP